MQGILAGIIDLIFPPRCVTCSAPLEGWPPSPFCPSCRAAIPFIASPLCPCCGRPFPVRDEKDHLCGECLTTPRPYEAMRALGVYDGALLTAIHRFKYRGRTDMGRILGAMMAELVATLWGEGRFTLVVPVPLHKKRLQERGFNQSVLLAREIARRLSLPLDLASLRRAVATPPQVGLGRDARIHNVRGAFTVDRPDRITGQRILLIDDVCTTGSTLNECASLLRRKGADAVTVLTAARALPDLESKEASTHGEDSDPGDLEAGGGETPPGR